MQRRRAIEMLGALAIVPSLRTLERFSVNDLLILGERAHASSDAESYIRRALTPSQHALVTAAAEQIIPRTDTPGATDAKVADFVDMMLAEWYSPAERDRFIGGIVEIDRRATHLHGSSFARCKPVEQLAMLRDADAEVSLNHGTAASQHWFAMLKFLTAWGYCTSRVVGIEGSSMVGRYDGNAPYVVPKPA